MFSFWQIFHWKFERFMKKCSNFVSFWARNMYFFQIGQNFARKATIQRYFKHIDQTKIYLKLRSISYFSLTLDLKSQVFVKWIYESDKVNNLRYKVNWILWKPRKIVKMHRIINLKFITISKFIISGWVVHRSAS